MLSELFGSFAGQLSLVIISFMIIVPTILLRILIKKMSDKNN